MPDQPDDPLHYEMKIPPEPQDATLHKKEQQRGSDEVTNESDKLERSEEKESSSDSPRSPRKLADRE